ncbi:hypothetical protein C8P69_10258 [Phreatobacter oligotrophus]|uniref:Uncharacterized protein n=1 Tax=Phreatobacter oligotrophus TaxID=1122261 RepID=A0A2T4ZFL7_9HYPH|nr:hypothetical protein C8P69_10258 [Phreatobacter oligotrophus]
MAFCINRYRSPGPPPINIAIAVSFERLGEPLCLRTWSGIAVSLPSPEGRVRVGHWGQLGAVFWYNSHH